MGASADEVDGAARLRRIIDLVDEKKSPAEKAFPVIRPPAFQRVVPPIGTGRGLVVDEVEHDRSEPIHIVPAGT